VDRRWTGNEGASNEAELELQSVGKKKEKKKKMMMMMMKKKTNNELRADTKTGNAVPEI
jgi:hypothetical protein